MSSKSIVASRTRGAVCVCSLSPNPECFPRERETEQVRIFAFEAVIGRVCRRMAFVLAHNLSLFVKRASESPALCSERREHKWAHIRLSISLLVIHYIQQALLQQPWHLKEKAGCPRRPPNKLSEREKRANAFPAAAQSEQARKASCWSRARYRPHHFHATDPLKTQTLPSLRRVIRPSARSACNSGWRSLHILLAPFVVMLLFLSKISINAVLDVHFKCFIM